MTAASHRISRRVALAIALLAVGFANGCAAVSNPVADGIPLCLVPRELINRPKSELVQVPLTLLRLKEQQDYKLDKGDMLAIIAGDLFAPEGTPPPVSTANPNDFSEAAVGYPVPVRDDGTISLPNGKIKPILVKGMTPVEVEVKLRKILTGQDPDYKDSGFFNKDGPAKISVQLMKKRFYRISVIREDTQGIPQSVSGTLTSGARRVGTVVRLEAGRNDVLNALNNTGGPPGLDGKNEVYIYHGEYDPENPSKGQTRIPLKIFPEQTLTITEADITLADCDIVVIPGREAELFYTGGVLGARQFPLPRDYDLDVVQAIMVANGPIVNGGFTSNAFVAQSFASGLGTPSPALVSVVRQLGEGKQIIIRIDLGRALKDPRERIFIQANDMIIVQEKPAEAGVRYLTQQIQINFVQQIFRTLTGSSSVTGNGP